MSGDEDIITAWFARQSKLSANDYSIGIGDDMAAIHFRGGDILVTTDMLIEGVHFDLQSASLHQVGYKAMAVILSDCAAMATVPVGAVVAVALPKGYGQKELKELHGGINDAAVKYSCPLLGGDITKWKATGGLCINSTITSRGGGGAPVLRSQANSGDVICVTGQLGGSGLGRHLNFEPRVKEALRITGLAKLNAMMDISDGLSTDLSRMCKASGVGAIIEAAQIPISQAAQKREDPLDSALNEGEDFELLFSLSAAQCQKLQHLWSGPVEITQIGQMTKNAEIVLKKADGSSEPLRQGGWDHL